MPSPRRLVPTVVAVLAAAALGACTSVVTGPGSPAGAVLQDALAGPVEGFQAGAAPSVPSEVCRDSGGTDAVPEPDPALGEPVASAAHLADEAELGAWAWQVSSPQQAAAIIDAALDAADNCAYEYFADYDEDGDGDLDYGASVVASPSPYENFGWTGLEVRTERDGSAIEEVRYVRMDDLVVLVRLHDPDGEHDVTRLVETYLEDLAATL